MTCSWSAKPKLSVGDW